MSQTLTVNVQSITPELDIITEEVVLVVESGGAVGGATGPQGPAGPTGPAGADGDDGREVELQTSATHVQWRYVGDVAWTNLVSLASITGPAGANGSNGTNGSDGVDGADGREVELQTSATHVQWRYVGEPAWTNLIALATITGPAGATGATGATGAAGANGKEVELQTSATHVQWRYVGDSTWNNLVALSTITGPAGTNGTNGTNGKEVELQTSATHVQWRYVGDPTWINLVALSAITGPAGATGAQGATGPVGPGVAAGGTTGQMLVKASGTDYDTAWGRTLSMGTAAPSGGSDGDWYAQHS